MIGVDVDETKWERGASKNRIILNSHFDATVSLYGGFHCYWQSLPSHVLKCYRFDLIDTLLVY